MVLILMIAKALYADLERRSGLLIIQDSICFYSSRVESDIASNNNDRGNNGHDDWCQALLTIVNIGKPINLSLMCWLAT